MKPPPPPAWIMQRNPEVY
nr:hypothetical protein [Escherichia coli]